MNSLPYQAVAKICSFTDDDTIFNLICTCRSFCALMNIAKDEILFQKTNEITYGLNVLKQTIREFSIIPYNVYNFENINVVKNYIGENINCIQHTYHVSSPDTEKRYSTYYFNADLLANDLLSSVKVKGEIYILTFEFQTSRSFYDKLTDGFMSILPVDENGYKEILSYFIPYVYFRLFPFSNIILKIQHIGDIDIKTTFVNFDNHHRNIIENLTFRRCNVVFTHAVIPDMLSSNLAYNTSRHNMLVQVYPSFISKGFCVVLKKDMKNIIEDPCKVIKSIEIDLYKRHSFNIVTKTFNFSCKTLTVDKLMRTGFYNLNFKLNENCLYIPLNNINFRNISQTILKFIFHKNVEITGLLDIIYFGDNMIMNKDGYGSRYYW